MLGHRAKCTSSEYRNRWEASAFAAFLQSRNSSVRPARGRSIRARALLKLSESPDRDDELTGSPALKQRVWRKTHDKRVGAVPQTRKTQGRPDAVSDAVKEPRRV